MKMWILVAVWSLSVPAAHGRPDIAGVGAVEGEALDPALEQEGWRPLSRSGIPETRFTREGDGVIEVFAEASDALIYRRVGEALEGCRQLSWEWRVERSMEPTDLRERRGDDRPVALHVAFDVHGSHLGVWQRLIGTVAAAVSGLPGSSKVLTYVWGGKDPAGTLFPNPYIARIGMVQVLRPGDAPAGKWFAEHRDVYADFEAAFGHPARRIVYIALSADSEATGETSLARVRDPKLSC